MAHVKNEYDVEKISVEETMEYQELSEIIMRNAYRWGNDIYAEVPIKCLVIPFYQRVVRNHARKIAEQFDPRQVGMIDVSLRPNGLFYIINGQHRTIASALVGNQVMKCQIHTELSVDDEIIMYLNKDRVTKPKLNLYDRIRAAVQVSEQADTDETKMLKKVCEIYTSYGLKAVPFCRDNNNILSISKVIDAYRSGGEQELRFIIECIQEGGWDTEPRAYENDTLSSLMVIYNAYKDSPRQLQNVKQKMIAYFKMCKRANYLEAAEELCPDISIRTRFLTGSAKKTAVFKEVSAS